MVEVTTSVEYTGSNTQRSSFSSQRSAYQFGFLNLRTGLACKRFIAGRSGCQGSASGIINQLHINFRIAAVYSQPGLLCSTADLFTDPEADVLSSVCSCTHHLVYFKPRCCRS